MSQWSYDRSSGYLASPHPVRAQSSKCHEIRGLSNNPSITVSTRGPLWMGVAEDGTATQQASSIYNAEELNLKSTDGSRSENTGSFSIELCPIVDGRAIKLAPRVLIAKAGFRSRSLYFVSHYVTRDSRPHLRHHDESIPDRLDSERGG